MSAVVWNEERTMGALCAPEHMPLCAAVFCTSQRAAPVAICEGHILPPVAAAWVFEAPTAICAPARPILATASADGRIRLFDPMAATRPYTGASALPPFPGAPPVIAAPSRQQQQQQQHSQKKGSKTAGPPKRAAPLTVACSPFFVLDLGPFPGAVASLLPATFSSTSAPAGAPSGLMGVAFDVAFGASLGGGGNTQAATTGLARFTRHAMEALAFEAPAAATAEAKGEATAAALAPARPAGTIVLTADDAAQLSAIGRVVLLVDLLADRRARNGEGEGTSSMADGVVGLRAHLLGFVALGDAEAGAGALQLHATSFEPERCSVTAGTGGTAVPFTSFDPAMAVPSLGVPNVDAARSLLVQLAAQRDTPAALIPTGAESPGRAAPAASQVPPLVESTIDVALDGFQRAVCGAALASDAAVMALEAKVAETRRVVEHLQGLSRGAAVRRARSP